MRKQCVRRSPNTHSVSKTMDDLTRFTSSLDENKAGTLSSWVPRERSWAARDFTLPQPIIVAPSASASVVALARAWPPMGPTTRRASPWPWSCLFAPILTRR